MIQYCKNCLFPSTKPELSFDENGICDACINAKKKENIDWGKRKEELKAILEKYKSKDGSNYDCIIPVSGGKDSHYQTYVIKEEFGLNPLLVSFHPFDFTELGRKNIENIKSLGVDCIEFSANPSIYRKMAKYGLVELGDNAWPEHIGIFTVPVQVAVAYKVPLLIWGENPQLEYGGPATVSSSPYLDKNWNEKHGGYFLDKIKPSDMTKYGIKKKDLLPFLYPSDESIHKVGVTGIFLGYYLKWDARRQVDIIKKVGFNLGDVPTEGTYTNYENLDTKHVAMHDYFKFIKYGFGRATDHASIDIRNNRLTRKEGLELVKKYEGKIPTRYMNDFLRDFEITLDEFYKICDKFTNKALFKTDENGHLIRDADGNIEKIAYDNE
ncbi:MAG: N-acetyl sugar amidotransferase [Nitrosarchaeum sp.]|nr:N-acetyl sugar amidotransferase [Nitrosarchaeum sp.]MCA9819708.1 N-acetyl sugar amidotransferase [Nitrosarchaeum sp.]